MKPSHCSSSVFRLRSPIFFFLCLASAQTVAAQEAPTLATPPLLTAPTVNAPAPTIEVYEVKHAEPDDLIRIVKALVPGVVILAGPTPSTIKRGFEAEHLGEQVSPNGSGVVQAIPPPAKYEAGARPYTIDSLRDPAAVNQALMCWAESTRHARR